MKVKRWVTATLDQKEVATLSKSCHLNPLAAMVLYARGMQTKEAIAQFLSTDEQQLHDPFLLPDMQKAVSHLQSAIDRGEQIIVYGDYDVDGVTSTCVLMDYLQSVGANCRYYIPNRMQEGYGLSKEALKQLADEGAKWIVTVDSGITAMDEIAYANTLGLQVIVTDHHECRETLPQAVAVVNPKRADSVYPFPFLAGVGVVFKLVCALAGNQAEMLVRYADLVALGTVADVMPIVGENRIIVAKGLTKLPATERIGLAMLLREAGQTDKKMTSGTISFVLAPRLNAAGRLGHATVAVDLLLTKDPNKAQEMAVYLCEQNRIRQETEAEILQQITVRLKKELHPIEDRVIVMGGEGWHHGVIGIVSSRICDRYGMPTILISIEGNTGKGSGRSLRGFHLVQALQSCEELLEKYGGHELAAGLTIEKDRIPALKERLQAYAQAHVKPEDMTPLLPIDGMLTPDQITEENVEGLSILEPFGMKNRIPVFAMDAMVVEEITPISSDRHVKLQLSKNGYHFTAMLFGTGIGGAGVVPGNYVDVAFQLEINTFRAQNTVQLIVQDMKLSECELLADQKLLSVYQRYMNDQPLHQKEAQVLMPDRKDLVSVWRYINSRAEEGKLSVPCNALSRQIGWESHLEMNIGKLFVCLDVFSESGLISYHFRDYMLHIQLKPYEGKADISQSVVLATLRKMSE